MDFRGPGYKDGVQVVVDEAKMGIRAFRMPDVPGFPGAIKQRYSDFVVREVALDGRVVRLTSVQQPDAKRAKKEKVGEAFKRRVFGFLDDAIATAQGARGDATTNSNNKMAIPAPVHALVGQLAGRLFGAFNRLKREAACADDKKQLQLLADAIARVCGDEVARDLHAYLLRVLDAKMHPPAAATTTEKATTEEDVFLFPEVAPKEHRAQIHEALRSFAGDLVISDTVQHPDPAAANVSVIRVRRMLVDGKKRKDIDRRAANKWPSDRREFFYCFSLLRPCTRP